MKQNKYDDPTFFAAYNEMPRSIHGLKAAGEWHVFQSLLPDLQHATVLDLGCGFGWHCRFVREQQSGPVIGVDISFNMLLKAREQTDDPWITYLQMPIEDIDFSQTPFDLVISSLAFHYLKDFAAVCSKIYACLKPGGQFIFSVEHPIFTARNEQDWHYDAQGNRQHWPIDHYQSEGERETSFLTKNVIKYHRTIATYLNDLIACGLVIQAVKEPMPTADMLQQNSEMKDESRRPMFLIVSVKKPE